MNTSCCLRASLVTLVQGQAHLGGWIPWGSELLRALVPALAVGQKAHQYLDRPSLTFAYSLHTLAAALGYLSYGCAEYEVETGNVSRQTRQEDTGGNRSTGDGTQCLLSIPWNIQVRFMLLYATKILGTSGLKLSWMWTVRVRLYFVGINCVPGELALSATCSISK